MQGPKKQTESRWQRVLRSLLYGRDVDRTVKAKARLGLAILVFTGIFSVIAVRLVMFATVSEATAAAAVSRKMPSLLHVPTSSIAMGKSSPPM